MPLIGIGYWLSTIGYGPPAPHGFPAREAQTSSASLRRITRGKPLRNYKTASQASLAVRRWAVITCVTLAHHNEQNFPEHYALASRVIVHESAKISTAQAFTPSGGVPSGAGIRFDRREGASYPHARWRWGGRKTRRRVAGRRITTRWHEKESAMFENRSV